MVTFGENLYDKTVLEEKRHRAINSLCMGIQSKTPPNQLQLAKRGLIKRHEKQNRRGYVCLRLCLKKERER